MRSLFLIIAGLLSGGLATHAHDPGISVATAAIRDEGTVEVVISMSLQDVDAVLPLHASRTGDGSPQEPIEQLAMDWWQVSCDDVLLAPAMAEAARDADGGVTLRVIFLVPRGATVKLRAALLAKMPDGHRIYFSAVDRRAVVQAEALLDLAHDQINLPSAAALRAAP